MVMCYIKLPVTCRSWLQKMNRRAGDTKSKFKCVPGRSGIMWIAKYVMGQSYYKVTGLCWLVGGQVLLTSGEELTNFHIHPGKCNFKTQVKISEPPCFRLQLFLQQAVSEGPSAFCTVGVCRGSSCLCTVLVLTRAHCQNASELTNKKHLEEIIQNQN